MGSSVPSSTTQYQQVATGIWGSPEATALAKPILKPALGNIKEQQSMLLGMQHGDPKQARKFFGLPEDSSLADIEESMHKATTAVRPQQLPPSQYSTNPQQPPAKVAARGGIMSLDDEGDERTFATGGDSAPKDLSATQSRQLANLQQRQEAGKLTAAQQNQLNRLTQQRQTYQTYKKEQTGVTAAAAQAGLTPAAAYLGQAGYFGFDPNTGLSTNPYYNQAIQVMQGMNQTPAAFGQAGQAYQDALSGLKSVAGYTPQQVSADQITAAVINRNIIRDVAAQQAAVERMGGGPNVQAIAARGEKMSGPKSWTQPGTAEQYMNPYVKNVVEQQQQLANQQFAQQQAQRSSQAAQQKAYGGSRAVLQAQEAQYQQNLANQSLAQQGLAGAYQQGMGQFQTESGLSQQAKQANLQAAMQANLANQQAGMTAQQLNQLYGQGGFQAQAANQAAQNQAANNYVQQMLTAQGMNQGMDWNTASQNATMQMQAMQANQNANLQAMIANQQAGIQANQQNIGAYSQMANIGQGLGSLGGQIGAYGSNLANMWGQAGSTLQGLGQNYYNQQQQNAANIFGGPTTLANQGMGLLGGMGGGQSGVTSQQQKVGG